ncbi:MAG TPA: S-layer homology domain-containing protein [Candidatus Nanopelagicales bacterium]|nr:S-layer homology domain-containing protein [Candidatus Nanopelagicales bacterium]
MVTAQGPVTMRNSPLPQPVASTFTRPALIALLALAAAAPLVASCAAAPGEEEHDHEADGDAHDFEERGDAFSGGTVADAASASCTTTSVKGLSLQIIEESNCLQPGAFEALPDLSNVTRGAAVFPYLQKPARDKLVAAIQANPSRQMTINSMLRTSAQQYLLYRWYQLGRCGISLAAKPGNSNHQGGLAIDIQEYSGWKTTLQNNGFRWLGSSDPWHYDYTGSGAKEQRSLDTLAFQRLWNRNNPNDKISEDGSWGPNTEARMKKTPAAGFATGAQCGASGGGSGGSTCDAAFSDICSSPHQDDIEWLAAQGISSGCGEGKFCPDAEVTREQMAGFLATALDLPAGPDAFTDDEASPYEASINAIAAAGISSGCGNGNFCPTLTVSRAQMATFLARAFELPAGPDAFVDDNGISYEPDINAIAAAGITSGCDAVNKLYCPDSKVTRGQMATFLRRALQ